ncbi:hypothetical protein CMV_008753 [Castanea mollissima]|uniref:Ferredoxin n=1 Tax=Castanea mollissima TaxID=60419 RepID=A0A8J4W1U9_9ROSI|nr:hypothetical protein CMV_008753 [Castanea mollissima]
MSLVLGNGYFGRVNWTHVHHLLHQVPELHLLPGPRRRQFQNAVYGEASALTTTGQTLLKALTNTGLVDLTSHRLEDIEACSTECEVNIAQKWLDMLPPRTYDEEYILKRSSHARVMNTHSRLACQIVLTPELQGMIVVVPEPKP